MVYNTNEYNIIDISKSQTRPKKYFCDYCRRHLYLRDKEKDP